MKPELEKVYLSHRRNLLAIAENITGCQQLGEDAIQSAFSKLIQRQECGENVTRYVFRTVRNAAIDLVRNRQRHPNGAPLFESEPQSRELCGAETTLLLEKLALVQSSINELQQDERELVLLKVFSGFTFEEIASITNVSANTVATRYRRLLDKLRVKLKVANE